ncbi:amino acid ABC transporter permease [Vagococcus carniphilus]|uniref:Amino acid ABC transporter permease n=1 Tax=Vagococcus carniphilus TaxID=218144 RepID=A0A430B7B2_9ENTE|nr:amino acid ABC transporter permease [Vagococcus carniphilus]MDT2830396.1 amino acid ABC transporter permease [Vagococcus carniphilus]MDT2832431.1 amino acid ABC transporter permease [Vagococcus carniphilus]MDT2840035.1 amino acid ABC transporter permease [Vagococcus carniphilus]MDT2854526.1 amino acid ABC transporter permease [Vagococcus carniphilus]QNN72342.1 amino acid ABC transporter permease [Vagococcus carniphilus]
MVNIWQMYQSDILSGLKVTLIASITALIFSLIIGTLMAIFQVSRNKWVKRIGNGYVNLFRNLPLLIVVMFLFVVLPLYGIKMDGITAGTVGLTLYTSAFIADTVRAGIEGIPKGQMEAGISSGLTHVQVMWYIILPQAFKIVIPPLGNQFINLVKNSSILAMVTGADLMYQGDLIASTTFNTIGTYTLIGLIYLVLTLPLSYLMKYLETRLAVS